MVVLDNQPSLHKPIKQPTMSTRFVIKNTEGKAEKEGDSTLRFSGVSEPFSHSSERYSKEVGVDASGQPKLLFITGLDDNLVQFYKWYNDEEKKEVKKQIKELKPLIASAYGGEEVIASDNKYFWSKNRDVSLLSLSNDDIDTFFDTKYPSHALLYLSIMAGAFIDAVSPTRDYAERNQIPHYMALETEATFDDEDDITRSDAHSLLSDLRKDSDPEALFILAWCLQYDTNAFGGINRSTPFKNLISTHIQYIDGKLTMKKKKNTPKTFIEYAQKWQGQQTRPLIYTEAYVKAGEYFNFINQREKKFVTTDGTVLGNTVQDAVETLMKPKFTQDLQKLRDQVEAKWKE